MYRSGCPPARLSVPPVPLLFEMISYHHTIIEPQGCHNIGSEAYGRSVLSVYPFARLVCFTRTFLENDLLLVSKCRVKRLKSVTESQATVGLSVCPSVCLPVCFTGNYLEKGLPAVLPECRARAMCPESDVYAGRWFYLSVRPPACRPVRLPSAFLLEPDLHTLLALMADIT